MSEDQEPVELSPTPSEPAPLDSVTVDAIAPTSLLPRLRKKGYKFSSYAREDHGNALYCVTFCDVLPIYERMFAVAGGNRLTVYECLENGGLDVIQVYCDGDQEEQYFTAAWTVDVLTG
ncbi:Polycomb protein, partial [Phytophthora palmivora]